MPLRPLGRDAPCRGPGCDRLPGPVRRLRHRRNADAWGAAGCKGV